MKTNELLSRIKWLRCLVFEVEKTIENNVHAKNKLETLDKHLFDLHCEIGAEESTLKQFLDIYPRFAKKDGRLSKQKKAVEMYEEFKKRR
jgi:hypothetical protein